METANYYELFIDIDTKFFWSIYKYERMLADTLELLKKETYIKIVVRDIYATQHGYHYYLDVFSPYELKQEHLLFLQALLDDDKRRCIFNFNRMLLGWKWKTNNVLFTENEFRSRMHHHKRLIPKSYKNFLPRKVKT